LAPKAIPLWMKWRKITAITRFKVILCMRLTCEWITQTYLAPCPRYRAVLVKFSLSTGGGSCLPLTHSWFILIQTLPSLKNHHSQLKLSTINVSCFFVSGNWMFKCNFDHSKSRFFKAFNVVYGKVGCLASDEVVLGLLRSKCLPVLLYATEACPLLSRNKQSLKFTITRIFYENFSDWFSRDCQRMPV